MSSINKRKKKDFLNAITSYTEVCNKAVSTEKGDWIIKGFIDIAKNVYTISVDTKVVSKIMELLLFPIFCEFARKYKFKMVLSDHQNHYPDLTFIDSKNLKYAVDIKSTYRKGNNKVNGMTLGAFTGQFRERDSNKNIKYPYNDYIAHYVFGLIYNRTEEDIDERRKYKIGELQNIVSVIKDFKFFVHEKYKIASDRPGSGNTKNIGSATAQDKLVEGKGPFSALGEEVFDDYWMYYLTRDMARAAELPKAHYKNLNEYKKFKGIK